MTKVLSSLRRQVYVSQCVVIYVYEVFFSMWRVVCDGARGIGRSIYKVCGGEIHEEPAVWKEMSILVVGRESSE
jgi:hypothetical protein